MSKLVSGGESSPVEGSSWPWALGWWNEKRADPAKRIRPGELTIKSSNLTCVKTGFFSFLTKQHILVSDLFLMCTWAHFVLQVLLN